MSSSKGRLTGTRRGIKLLKYFSSSLALVAVSLMPLTSSDLAQRVAQEALGYLGAVSGPLADQSAERIKNYVPGESIPQLGIGVARQACRRYADNPAGVTGVAASGLERMCRPYLTGIKYGTGPSLITPLKGGQCDGNEYRFQLSYQSTGGTVQGTPQLRGTGPLSVRAVVISKDVNGAATAYALDIRSKRFWIEGASPPPVGPIAWATYTTVTTSVGASMSVRMVNVVNLTNAADACGNPPVEYQPPVGPTVPGPVREPYAPGPGVNVDIDVTVGPTGDITFNIGTGPITISPFGGGGGGDDGGDNPGIDQPGTAPSSGLPPGDIGSPSAPVAVPAGGVGAGTAPPNSVLVGVKVDILAPLPSVSLYDPQVIRGVCYVYMGVPGNLALDQSGVALRSGQFCLAPVDNLTAWEVRANVGFMLSVTPYYRTLEIAEV